MCTMRGKEGEGGGKRERERERERARAREKEGERMRGGVKGVIRQMPRVYNAVQPMAVSEVGNCLTPATTEVYSICLVGALINIPDWHHIASMAGVSCALGPQKYPCQCVPPCILANYPVGPAPICEDLLAHRPCADVFSSPSALCRYRY